MNKTGAPIIRATHYIKLVYRSALLVAAVVLYMTCGFSDRRVFFAGIAVWAVFMAEMILRMFPMPFDSMGSRKQFKKYYIPSEGETKPNGIRTFITAVSWLLLNAVIGTLYFAGIIDSGALILISLFYAVCDMICVLVFCPFQKWLLKTRCCTTCRIYNWDYAMMFTPLIFLRGFFPTSLFIMSVIVLLQWEIKHLFRREYFYETANKSLMCENCKEKNCRR